MEKYEITKEQILELAKESSFSNAYLQKHFPQAFQKELEVGKIYRDNQYKEHIFCVTKLEDVDYHFFGFNTGGLYKENDWYSFSDNETEKGFTEATPEEWKEAMTNELIRRYGENWKNVKLKKSLWHLHSSNNGDCGLTFSETEIWNRNGMIFKDGIFAEVLVNQS